MEKREFTVIIEKDESGWFIADVPELSGCHTQGRTRAEVLKNIKEAIELCIEVAAGGKSKIKSRAIDIAKVAVYA